MFMGSYLMRTGKDESMLVGDFYILIGQLSGIKRPAGKKENKWFNYKKGKV